VTSRIGGRRAGGAPDASARTAPTRRYAPEPPGSSTSTGTTVEIATQGHAYEPLRQNPGLVAAFARACETIGRPLTLDPAGPGLSGSTDMGNVSQLVPTLHADMAVHSWPAVNHQHEFAAHCVGPQGDQTLLEGAKAMALTALAFAADPSIVEEAAN